MLTTRTLSEIDRGEVCSTTTTIMRSANRRGKKTSIKRATRNISTIRERVPMITILDRSGQPETMNKIGQRGIEIIRTIMIE
jgi:hypothetical protein